MSRDDRYKYSASETPITVASDRLPTTPWTQGYITSTSGTKDERKILPVMNDARQRHIRYGFIKCGDGAASSVDGLRPDIAALGIGNFEEAFDPDRIYCIFQTSNSIVSLVFFHVEGMATLFGVGLPFSELLLKPDLVEIREIGESTWKDRWTKQSEWQSCPLLFQFTEDPTARRSQDPKVFTSYEQAAERLGAGAEGSCKFGESTDRRGSLPGQVIGEQPEWLELLRKLLLDEGGSDCPTRPNYMEAVSAASGPDVNKSESESTAPGSVSTISESSDSIESRFPYLSISGNFLANMKRLLFGDSEIAEGSESGSQTEYKTLQLTVVVYLDPFKYTFYSPPEELEMHMERLQYGKVKISRNEFQMELSDYQLVPIVTVAFICDPTTGGRLSRKLQTTLDVKFHKDGSISDENQFGWYHDKLRSSFSCLEPNTVIRESLQPEVEILSMLEQRTAEKIRGAEDSTLDLKSRGKDFQVTGGYQSVAQVRFTGTTKKEVTTGNILRDQSTGQIVTICLKDANFAVRNVERGAQELAYMASLFPPISYYNVWSKVDRELALASGMMSNVHLQTRGTWMVKEQGGSSSQTSILRDYNFFCERILVLHRSVTPPPVKPRRFRRHAEEGKKKPETLQLLQKLSRGFLVNHSFSHFSRLQRSEAYIWHIPMHNNSPVEEIIK
ncbi:hypothetical protein Mapa_009332 [Marchantia paleacea]|nr:hypothetical protein Mapa_009332 [Marchantia paleacea]